MEQQHNAEIQRENYNAHIAYNYDRDYTNQKESFYKNLCWGLCSIVPLIVCLAIAGSKSWDGGSREIIIIAIALKITTLLPLEIIYLWLIKRRKLTGAGVTFIKLGVMVLMLGWYIYVVVAFFSSNNKCRDDSEALWVGHLILVIEWFIMFLLYSFIWWVFICMITYICILLRQRAKERRANIRIKDLILKATSLKLNVNDLQNDDICSICFENYSEGQEIIRLPCDERHHFHSDWIGNWIETKSNWPIWKQEFTEETVKSLKKSGPRMERNNNLKIDN